jgi:N-acetylmuramoyl-L-alanine amidase
MSLKVAWSVGHDPLHSGAFSRPLGEKEHDLAREVVDIGIKAIKALSLDWDIFNPSDVVQYEHKDTMSVLRDKIILINEWGADIALESHFNSSSNHEVRGCETLYFSLPFGDRFSPEGKRLAELIQDSTLSVLNRAPFRTTRPALTLRDRGAKGMGSIRRIYNGVETFPRYRFLTQTKMPAVILEPLFISSPHDTVCLLKDRRREIHRLAIAVVGALVKWNTEDRENEEV